MDNSFKDSSSGQFDGPSKISSLNFSSEVGLGAWGIPLKNVSSHPSSHTSLFSTSLPILSHDKLNVTESGPSDLSLDDGWPCLGKLCIDNESKDAFNDDESNVISSLLPDEDDLFAGVMDDFDISGLPNQLEDLEDYDIFGTGGGMEMDLDCSENLNICISKDGSSDGISGNGIGQFSLSNGIGMVAGEHPYGEHPSRTLFVRNINSNVEDSELKTLFEQYGDIRTLYTACKHRGFVMISYYDIRAARTAMRALQNKPLRRRKLDIHFSIPKDNPSEKDINQGTLVVFNLDASVSNEELRQIFGAYGEVKEIRETPHKRHHKFIEYYDVRAAEAALRALNRCDIAGKRIKLEPSRPGGARRNLMQQLSQDLEQDEVCGFRNNLGSPLANSPPGNWPQFGSPVECTPSQTMNESPNFGSPNPINTNGLPGLASILPKIAPIGKDHSGVNHLNRVFSNVKVTQGTMSQEHSHSYPDQKLLSLSPGPISPFTESKSNPNSNPNPNSSGVGTLSGPQFLWGSPSPNSFPWSSTSSLVNPISYHSRHNPFLGPHHHHVGSAPSGIPMDRHFGYFPESPEMTFIPPVGFRGVNNGSGYLMNMGSGRSPMTENGSPVLRMIPLTRHGPFFPGNGSYTDPGTDGMGDRNNRSRRVDNNNGGGQMENKKQYQLDLDKIIRGEDSKTTLMIKNIPNKYTSKMLLAAIDENHRGTYDFLYLPIDFKNKCNVGYAFINMVSPSHIIPFYEAFDGKRWEKFNSEKVASLAYARIQGKAALITHFQNSSLMNEDKRCRPILFHSEGQQIVDQEPLPSSNLNICIRQPDGSYCGDSLESPEENESG